MEFEVEIKKRENVLTNFNGGVKLISLFVIFAKEKEIVFLTLTIKILIYYAWISDSYNDLSSN